MTQNSRSTQQQHDKALALLGLAVTESQQKAKNCPDAEEIAAYVDGNLNSQQQQSFRARLQACPDSYQLWLSVQTADEQEQQTLVTTADKSFWQRLKNSIITSMHKPFTPFGTKGIAAFASIVLVVLLLRIPSGPPDLSEQYQQLLAQAELSRLPMQVFEQHAIANQKAVSPSSQVFIDPNIQAFQNGLTRGVTSIQEQRFDPAQSPACLSQVEDCQHLADLYHYAGSWAVISQAACSLQQSQLINTQQQLFAGWQQQWQKIKGNQRIETGLEQRLLALYQQQGLSEADFCQATLALIQFVQK